MQELALLNIQRFSYETIRKNTYGFHHDCILGRGGFGIVYKAILMKTDFAIKKLKPVSVAGLKLYVTLNRICILLFVDLSL